MDGTKYTMLYNYESELVDQFVRIVESKNSEENNKTLLANEYDYNNGRVDIVKVNKYNELVAIEAKLNKWKTALNQAYRNTSFAHYSFVLLPQNVAMNALRREKEFKIRGVGILTIENGKIKTLLESSKSKPIQPWLTSRAFEFIGIKNEINGRTKECSKKNMQAA